MVEQPQALQHFKLEWWFNEKYGIDETELITVDANRETFINSFTLGVIRQMQN